jgi:hypothetical protein
VSFPRIGLKHKDAILYSGVTGYPSFFFIILLAANDRAKRKKKGWWSVRELGRDAPSCRLTPAPEGGIARFSWCWQGFPAIRWEKVGRNRGDFPVYCSKLRSQNGNPG